MRSLAVAFSLWLALPSYAGVDLAFPRRQTWEKWILEKSADLSREQRIQLASYFPRLFGFRFACQFAPAQAGGKPSSVLPGEFFEASEAGTLHCPGFFDAALTKQTKVRLSQVGPAPGLYLEKGNLELSLGQNRIFLESSAFQLGLEGLSKQQYFSFSAADGKEVLSCTLGNVAGEIETLEASASKAFLTSSLCRMDFSLLGSTQTRSIWSGDKVQVENLALARRFWPGLNLANVSQPHKGRDIPDIILEVPPSANNSGPIQVNWRATILGNGHVVCKPMLQKSDSEPYVELPPFELKTALGSFSVDRANLGATLAAMCTDGESTFTTPAFLLRHVPLITPPLPAPTKKP